VTPSCSLNLFLSPALVYLPICLVFWPSSFAATDNRLRQAAAGPKVPSNHRTQHSPENNSRQLKQLHQHDGADSKQRQHQQQQHQHQRQYKQRHWRRHYNQGRRAAQREAPPTTGDTECLHGTSLGPTLNWLCRFSALGAHEQRLLRGKAAAPATTAMSKRRLRPAAASDGTTTAWHRAGHDQRGRRPLGAGRQSGVIII
jgi:hypothetical protein